MKKIISAFIFLVLAYVMPLLGKLSLLFNYKILLLMTAAVFIFLSQPALGAGEVKKERKTDQHTVWYILLASLIAAALPVIEWAYWHPDRHAGVFVVTGLLMVITGIGLRFWSIRTLGPYFTATVQVKQQQQLIQHGPYTVLRHPSYTGALLAILGCAIILQAWYALVIAALAMGFAYRERIEKEEKALIDNFGAAYVRYQASTHKLIPFVW